MKNYSFSNIANEQTYVTRKSNDFSNLYRHSDLKGSEANQRIEEIKKKYDTPSRRQRIQSLKKSKDYEMMNRATLKQQSKENGYQQHKPAPTFGSNHLKESFAVNRLEKSTLNKNDFDNKDFMNLRSGEKDYGRSNEKENENAAYKPNRESEEAVFSKVREMKESILNSNYMKSSAAARNGIASGKYAQLEGKNEGRRDFEPRVENIDKINSKIKQILSCLSENQKNSNKYPKETTIASTFKEETNMHKEPYFGVKTREIAQSKKSYQSHFNKNSDVVEKINIFDHKPAEEPKELSQAPIEAEPSKGEVYNSKSSLEYQRLRNRDYSVNRVEYPNKDYTVTRQTKAQQEIFRTPVYLNKDFNESKASRSKSQIDSIKKSSLAPPENGNVLKSGKKINDQISRIQKKIEEFQKEKRKLNIEFTPFTLKNKSQANLNISFNERQPQNVDSSLKNESRESNKNIAEQRSSSNDFKFKSYMNRAATYEEKYGNFTNKSRELLNKQLTKNTSIYENVKPKVTQEGDFQLNIQQVQVKTIRLEKDVDHNQEENFNQIESKITFDEDAIKKRTDEGIQERRKKLQGEDNIITTQGLKNIVKLFCEQVRLDQIFRNQKIWLQSCFESDKFSKIRKMLEKEGISLSQKDCQSLFVVDQSQNNPFFSVQSYKGSFQSLTCAYLQADRHWKSKILHKFQKTSLTSQGFSCQKIDLERKGYIQLEDLVRFLNIQSGTFYRNRDLFLIFHRLCSSDKLNFDSMLTSICA